MTVTLSNLGKTQVAEKSGDCAEEGSKRLSKLTRMLPRLPAAEALRAQELDSWRGSQRVDKTGVPPRQPLPHPLGGTWWPATGRCLGVRQAGFLESSYMIEDAFALLGIPVLSSVRREPKTPTPQDRGRDDTSTQV